MKVLTLFTYAVLKIQVSNDNLLHLQLETAAVIAELCLQFFFYFISISSFEFVCNLLKKNLVMASSKQLHSGIFHPTLRKWQERDVEILPENLMYPLFLM